MMLFKRNTYTIPSSQSSSLGVAIGGGEHDSNVALRRLKLRLLDLIALKKAKKAKKGVFKTQ
jgi:hypothetical protein